MGRQADAGGRRLRRALRPGRGTASARARRQPRDPGIGLPGRGGLPVTSHGRRSRPAAGAQRRRDRSQAGRRHHRANIGPSARPSARRIQSSARRPHRSRLTGRDAVTAEMTDPVPDHPRSPSGSRTLPFAPPEGHGPESMVPRSSTGNRTLAAAVFLLIPVSPIATDRHSGFVRRSGVRSLGVLGRRALAYHGAHAA